MLFFFFTCYVKKSDPGPNSMSVFAYLCVHIRCVSL